MSTRRRGASERNRPLYLVVLAPRVEVIEQREAGRSEVACRAADLWPAELDAALRADKPRLGLWLDSSDQSPEETVSEIARRSADALVGTV